MPRASQLSAVVMVEGVTNELLDLRQYAKGFAQAGYDKLSDVSLMTEGLLIEDIGMKKGHAKRFMRRLHTDGVVTTADE